MNGLPLHQNVTEQIAMELLSMSELSLPTQQAAVK